MDKFILYPMTFYVFYMWGLALYNFRTRVRAVKGGEVSPKYFKTFSDGVPTEWVTRVGRHYDNQFQLPILFFVTGLAAIVMEQVDHLMIALAWVFVVSRLAHSYVHLGSNKIMARVFTFALGWLTIAAMWIYIASK